MVELDPISNKPNTSVHSHMSNVDRMVRDGHYFSMPIGLIRTAPQKTRCFEQPQGVCWPPQTQHRVLSVKTLSRHANTAINRLRTLVLSSP